MMQWIIPIVFILTGLLAGIIFKKLKIFVVNKQIPGSEVIFQSLHRMSFIWFVLAGFFWAILSSPLKPDIAKKTSLQNYKKLTRFTAGFIYLNHTFMSTLHLCVRHFYMWFLELKIDVL
jgi:hypothetical protein